MADRLKLDRIAFYGRTLAEYTRMYALDLAALRGQRVLDCPGGASSFTAEALSLGIRAAACDILYGGDMAAVLAQGQADIEHTVDGVAQVAHMFHWDFYGTPNGLKTQRTAALHGFAAHYPGGGRYINARLPRLPFADQTFALVLSGHLLFTYGDRLDYDFHLKALRELYRVTAGEVRVYPLQGLDARPYPHLSRLLDDLRAQRIHAEIRPVPFEFQRGSSQILCLSRSAD
ncbi:MAG: class I SAM-dependent methyltransferase [Chloroflexi bacterium]|nr:class I SAM-dependent methyltransferase [Chloroflexota bacterium]